MASVSPIRFEQGEDPVSVNDFVSEVRGRLDVNHLLEKSVILLDLNESIYEEIFKRIIGELATRDAKINLDAVQEALFVQDEGTPFNSLRQTLQSISSTGEGGMFTYDQTWVSTFCTLDGVEHRNIAIARLHSPINLGRTMEEIRFVIVVVGPPREKGTKTVLEAARTFGTLFADIDVKQRLLLARSVNDFKAILISSSDQRAQDPTHFQHKTNTGEKANIPDTKWYPGRGIAHDFKLRIRLYASDYYDGVKDRRAIQKTLSTTVFLFFTCLLPAIAFGVFNDENTNGQLNVKKVIFAQAVGGIFFAIFSGQPMNIALTSAPLAIYIKVIYTISESFGYDFFAMYACVGLWCQFFLTICAFTEAANVMKSATRSTEELFGMFIVSAFHLNAFKAIYRSFQEHYFPCDEKNYTLSSNITNMTNLSSEIEHFPTDCHRDTAILFIILTFGTLWIGLSLFNLRSTPYLTRGKRDILADYALAVGVIVMSIVGTFVFRQVEKDVFDVRLNAPYAAIAPFWTLPLSAYFVSMGLGFSLCFLFFMDQCIVTATAENPQHKLKKPTAAHMDLLGVAILNVFFSIVGMPWMHAAIPQAPLHVRALADIEERVVQGRVYR
uniref:Bicarbonate transporter-like transmembrane domain-containing protein n=1 Tax=Plectus sambesii TaxID=2011161 RepID=A0A914WXG6_9BILA